MINVLDMYDSEPSMYGDRDTDLITKILLTLSLLPEKEYLCLASKIEGYVKKDYLYKNLTIYLQVKNNNKQINYKTGKSHLHEFLVKYFIMFKPAIYTYKVCIGIPDSGRNLIYNIKTI